MYTSPIDVIYGEMQMQVEGEIYKAVQKVDVNVDKEELLKALQYDREQYERGHKDGYAKAITEFAEQLKTILDIKFSFGTSNKFKLFNSIDEIAEEMRCAE